MASIKVLEIKPVMNGCLRAFVKLKIGETIFHDFRIIQQPGKQPWVSPPASSWKSKDGKTRYKPLIQFPKRLDDAVSEAVLKAWLKQQEKAQI